VAEAQLDTGGGHSFQTSKGVPDLFDEATGRPALSTSSNTTSIASETPMSDGRPSLTVRRATVPAATEPSEEASDEPTEADSLDPALVLQVEEARHQRLRQTTLPALPAEPIHPGAKPDRYRYDDPDAFERALMDHGAAEARWRAERQQYDTLAQRSQQHQQAVTQSSVAVLQARQEAFKKSHPDYDEVALRTDLPITEVMVHAMLQTPNAAEIAYYLGKHPDEAARIARLEPGQALMEMGRLEVKVRQATPQSRQSTTASRPARRTEPAPPARAAAAAETVEAFRARRTKELREARRPGYR
jgi:hypothetical protein